MMAKDNNALLVVALAAFLVWLFVFGANPWIGLLFLLVAIAMLNFRTVRVIPGMLKIRRAANANLTGVKMRYFPHMRRSWMYVLMAFHGTMDVLIGFFLVPAVFAEWYWAMVVGILFLVLGLIATIGFGSFALWYDDLHWKTRTIKPDIMDPIPWNGNHLTWTRTVGQEAARKQKMRSQLTGLHTDERDKLTPQTAEYWVARESPPDQWWGKPPAAGYFVVWKKASGETHISLSENGYQYAIRGHIDSYMLGGGNAETFAEGLPPRYRRLVDGLDPELRAFVYANFKDPKPAWDTGVLVIEKPDTLTPQDRKDAVSSEMLILMDLRAKAANYRRSEDQIAEDKQRMEKRLTQGK